MNHQENPWLGNVHRSSVMDEVSATQHTLPVRRQIMLNNNNTQGGWEISAKQFWTLFWGVVGVIVLFSIGIALG